MCTVMMQGLIPAKGVNRIPWGNQDTGPIIVKWP